MSTFDRTVREQAVQLVTIVGEPGVGKSRLLHEFRMVIDDRPDLVSWRQGRCLSYGEGITFWALGEIIKAQAGIHDSDGPSVAGEKLGRTVEKALGRPADHVLLVLDATTGQNAIQQAQLFKDALPLTGIVLTKLDGTAKGGVILGIVDRHGVPIEFIGIGERVEDLKAFDTEAFLEALFEAPESLETSDEALNAS